MVGRDAERQQRMSSDSPKTDAGKQVAEHRSARAIIRERLAQLVADYPDRAAPEIADMFARTLPDEDRHLVELFLASEARNILTWELRAQFGLPLGYEACRCHD